MKLCIETLDDIMNTIFCLRRHKELQLKVDYEYSCVASRLHVREQKKSHDACPLTVG
jgi:hypothetical protein